MEIDVENVVREYIEKTVHLSLGTSRDNKPWVCEVHFAYDDNLNLYFRSKASRRHSEEIAANPNVAGNIVKQHELDEAVVGAYFEGKCRMLELGEELELAYECISKRLKSGAGHEMLEEARTEDGHKFYKITVENRYVFGRFGAPNGQKHKLEWNGGKK
jgi:uncharacterized protein YhbP (UPF0306 family)